MTFAENKYLWWQQRKHLMFDKVWAIQQKKKKHTQRNVANIQNNHLKRDEIWWKINRQPLTQQQQPEGLSQLLSTYVCVFIFCSWFISCSWILSNAKPLNLSTKRPFLNKCKLEIWPKRPRYFPAASHHHTPQWAGGWHVSWGVALSSRGGITVGSGTFQGGGVAHPWGVFDFGPYLVDRWQGVASMGEAKHNSESRWAPILLRAIFKGNEARTPWFAWQCCRSSLSPGFVLLCSH